jgi:xanthine dehydrogenase YagS FAD-binding subunit
MKTFQHYNARSMRQATALLAKYNGKARLNAGGTDLIGSLRDQCMAEYPEALINIKTIPNLEYIKAGRGGLRIGALTRLADVVRSPEIQQDYAMLAEATRSVAAPNLRNAATVGGNLAQDIRCWYYRYPQHIGGSIKCLRKGGKTCNALTGDNRYHSIFGVAPAPENSNAGRGCVAVGPSDLAIVLVALDAKIVTSRRTLPAQEFFAATTVSSTVLQFDEMIKEVQIPKQSKGARQRFLKFTLRKPIDFAVVSVASVLSIQNGVCSDARIVLGGVAPAPLRATAAEEIMAGKPVAEAIAVEAADAALASAKPLSRNKYKVDIARTLMKRAILGLSE